MARVLPGVYSSINDISALPEGANSLVVGIVLQATKGTIGAATLQTTPADLLTNYTFAGTVKPNDDKSFHTAIKILGECNQLYVSRAAKNALYGGLVIKKEDQLGKVLSLNTSSKVIIEGDKTASLPANAILRVHGVSTILDAKYTVVSTVIADGNTEVTVAESIASNYTYKAGIEPQAFRSRQPIAFNQEQIAIIAGIDKDKNAVLIDGDDVTAFFPAGDKIEIKNATKNKGIYTVVTADYSVDAKVTAVTLQEAIPDVTEIGSIFRNSIVNPDSYQFKPEDLSIITGVDQGAYNGDISIKMISSKDDSSIVEPGACQVIIVDALTNSTLESFMFSRSMSAKATDGTNLYIEDVLDNSAAVRAVNNIAVDEAEIPCSTINTIRLSGGSDGDKLTDADLVEALQVFGDKIIPISILANGSIESPVFQQAMIELAETRQDIFAFVNSRLTDEKATTNSKKASNIVDYKKNTLSSTSFYAAMYAPHVTIPDVFNSRNIKVGADAKAIPGWLNVIRTQGYPYACAGYRHGQVNGVTCDWKIGDASGEATALNDASVNFIAFDAIQGNYLFWTQNTLQVANSALRDIGVVLNVLDVKQSLTTLLKQYLNLPITDDLRDEIMFTCTNFMDGIKSAKRVSDYVFQDVSTDSDISDDTLRYVLTLAPTKYAQKIYLVMDIVNQTFNFKILQSL